MRVVSWNMNKRREGNWEWVIKELKPDYVCAQEASPLPNKIKALQWHSYEDKGLESKRNVNIIGSSPTTKYQIFGYNNHAYGIQFHLEIRKSTVDDWAAVPEYKNALEQSLGQEALPHMKKEVDEEIDNMMAQCNHLYQNFISII